MRTIPGRTDHVVVVGAGLAGLSATLHLLDANRRVTLVERDPLPGGRAGLIERGGHRFDTGPTVLTMPHLLEEAFDAVGQKMADRLTLHPLHPAYHARFADGSSLDVHTDAQAMEAEIERFAGGREAAGYRRLRQWLQELYQAQMGRFIEANFDSPLSLLHPDLARLAALGGSAASSRRSPNSSRTSASSASSPSRPSTRASLRPARSPPTPSLPTWTPLPGVLPRRWHARRTRRPVRCRRRRGRHPPPRADRHPPGAHR
ncbi:FAD-dependent oxidoreductase [Streptomyces sp. MS1.HAVA.3]|uniref:FAD-dependent oxidoreductase n=1 Tax=Streptomyces caledonius TaxID=3134107 RepID=A0ABU8U2N6_9ACTN